MDSRKSSKKDLPLLGKTKSDKSDAPLERDNKHYSSTNSLMVHDSSPVANLIQNEQGKSRNYNKHKHQASYEAFDLNKLRDEF
jgi:hypothetical protein